MDIIRALKDFTEYNRMLVEELVLDGHKVVNATMPGKFDILAVDDYVALNVHKFDERDKALFTGIIVDKLTFKHCLVPYSDPSHERLDPAQCGVAVIGHNIIASDFLSKYTKPRILAEYTLRHKTVGVAIMAGEIPRDLRLRYPDALYVQSTEPVDFNKWNNLLVNVVGDKVRVNYRCPRYKKRLDGIIAKREMEGLWPFSIRTFLTEFS